MALLRCARQCLRFPRRSQAAAHVKPAAALADPLNIAGPSPPASRDIKNIDNGFPRSLDLSV